MKKGKKIWKRLLSLVLCLVMVTGMFAGMGMEAKAVTLPHSDTQGDDGKISECRLTPGNTAKEFYDYIKNSSWGRPAYGRTEVYITTTEDASTGYNLKDIVGDNITFSDGRYYVYVYSTNGSSINRTKNRVQVRVAYSVGISISGAPSGGSIIVENKEYGNGSIEVANDAALIFSVKSVTDYTPSVTFSGTTYLASNGTYEIPANDIKNATDRKIQVNYNLTNGSEVTITQNSNAEIQFNGNTQKTQSVGKSSSYEIQAIGKNNHVITGIYVDGIVKWTGKSDSANLSWKPTDSAHMISVTTMEKKIAVKANQSVEYREDMNKLVFAKAIFSVIYDEINSTYSLTEENVGTTYDSTVNIMFKTTTGEKGIYAPDAQYDIWGSNGLGDDSQEDVGLRYKVESSPYSAYVESDLVKLQLNKINIAANGSLSKVYDGTPMNFSMADGVHFTCNGYKEQIKSLEIVGHYDSKNQSIAPPTEAGTYYVKVKATDALGYNISDYIEYKITKRPIKITANNQIIDFGEAINAGSSAVTVEGLLNGHSVNCIVTASTTGVTTNGELTVSNVSIQNGNADYTNNYIITCHKGNLTINKIESSALDISFENNGTLAYNGEYQKPLVIKLGNKTLTDGQDYNAVYSNNKNVGQATVKVTSPNWDDEITETFTIKKKNITAAVVNADETYDGTTKAENASIQLTGVFSVDDNAVSVDSNISYENANVGTGKPVTAKDIKLTGSASGNYQLVDAEGTAFNENTVLTTIGTISKREIEVTADKVTKAYGDDDPELTWKVTSTTQVVEGEHLSGISTSRAVGENVGSYTITVSQAEDANSNYDITFVTGTLSINRKDLTVEITVLDKQYDGYTTAAYKAQLNGVVGTEDVTLNTTEVTAAFAQTNVGENLVVALTGDFSLRGTADFNNYNLIQPEKAGYTAKIYNTYDATEYQVSPNEWTNDIVTIKAENGFSISLGNDISSTWGKELSYSKETDVDGENVEFYIRNNATKAISLPETVTYYIDKTPPTGSITIAENTWNWFLNRITFEKFFNETQTVIIETNDTLSGIAKVEYYESSEGLTEIQVGEIAEEQWTEGKRVDVTLEDAKKFVYYARITDNAGNQTCISSDGNVYDITDPTITGVINDATYYTTQEVIVSDTNQKNVTATLNGSEFMNLSDENHISATVGGNVSEDTICEITATDKAGNKTTVKFTMKPLEDLVGDITENNITLEDKKELEESKALLENGLTEENLPNLIAGEEQAIRKKLEVIQKLLQNIDEVQKVIEMLENLPDAYKEDGETVNPYVADRMDEEDEGLYSAVKAAYSAYKKLSAHQQSLISTSLKHNLSNLRKVLTDYRIIDGDGKVWVHNTNGTLTFTANAPVCRFEKALVDGKEVPVEEMKVIKGSTVVELDAGYLYRLGLGDHTFQMVYEDGKTDVAEFSIVTMEEYNAMMNQTTGTNQTGTGAATGDSANILLWGVALAVGAVGIVVAKKKRKNEEA